MKRALYILLVAVIGSSALAQQEYTYTFFGDNLSFFNPGATGTKDYAALTGSFRKQWVGFDGSPTSGGVSYEHPLKSYNMGVGGMIYQDHVGETNQTNIAGLYSYQVKLGGDHKISFGVNAGIDLINTKFDRLTYWDEEDRVFNNDYVNVVVPHVGLGAHYYVNDFYVGVSVPRVISLNNEQFNSINFDDAPSLVTHYYLASGYKFDLGGDFNLKPSLLLKYTKGPWPQIDLSVSSFYRDMIGLGVAYKSLGFASAYLQYNYKNAVLFGYGFDFTTSRIREYSKGSHEIMIQYQFGVLGKRSQASFE